MFVDLTAAYDMAPRPHTETASDATEPTYVRFICFPSHHNRVFASYNQVDQLPVLGEIAPPALMREAATLVLGRLHDAMENSTHAPKET